jgi:dihydropyrimidinase/allantoinase
VQRAALIAQHAGAPLYIVHTSSAAALQAGLRHRRAGTQLLLETCPHYLTHDVCWSGGDLGKINPPLREPADRAALWQAVLDGGIDTIATDHVHRGPAGKQGGIWAASPGCPGMQTMLPVLLSEGHAKRGLSLERVTELTSTNPARAMGLSHCKGAIVPGLDADLTVIDPASRWTVPANGGKSSAGYSIYGGWELTGRVVHTLSRGRIVVRDGALQEQTAGSGRYVARSLTARGAA